jgi:hypothetical protein
MEGFAYRVKHGDSPEEPQAYPGVLNLKLLLPVKDLRKFVLSKLDILDRAIVRHTHGHNEFHVHDMPDLQIACASKGYLALLEYLFDPQECIDELTKYAAKYGHIHILAWLLQHKRLLPYKVCPTAAKHGHVHVLEWARAQGLPWDDHTCIKAAKAGQLPALVYALDHGCRWDYGPCMIAAMTLPHGHDHVTRRYITMNDIGGIGICHEKVLHIECASAFRHKAIFSYLQDRLAGIYMSFVGPKE